MELGKQIKKYRQESQLSQEELANRVYVSRQTISNWENDKSYPDVNSLVLLSEIFQISLDNLIKGDIEVMKDVIQKEEIEKMNRYGKSYTIMLIATAVSAVPLFMWLGVWAFIPWGIIWAISMYFAFKVETLIQRNWLLGYRIASEELQGEDRAKYGAEIIKKLAKELSAEYGKGYTKSNLYSFYSFYKTYPEIFQTSSGKSVGLLSWSHYATLLQVKEKAARDWYEKEAAKQTWSVRTLQRNISSQYYYRMLKTQKKELVESEMKELTAPYQNDKLEFIKNPVVAEFLGFSQNTDFTESDLEKSILSNLQKFLMELGKGYAFVARQQHIHTEKQDYYIDLVFYNYILKCFVLIDLKTEKITHQDVGQMDMYIRMYDELKRSEGDNPTIGIVLCSDTDDDIARYSVMHGNEQLFASKYKLYLPTKEELKAEIETQKAMFYLQQQDNEDRNKNYTFNIE